MAEETTIWSDSETRDKLKEMAEARRLSMAAQLRLIVDKEYKEMQSQGLIQSSSQQKLSKQE